MIAVQAVLDPAKADRDRVDVLRQCLAQRVGTFGGSVLSIVLWVVLFEGDGPEARRSSR